MACKQTSLALIKTIQFAKYSANTEKDVVQYLEQQLSYCDNYVGFSFSPIVAFASNSRIIHYTRCSSNINDGLLLLDIGGQFTYGTTDMTRTITTRKFYPTSKMRLHSITLYSCIKISNTF